VAEVISVGGSEGLTLDEEFPLMVMPLWIPPRLWWCRV